MTLYSIDVRIYATAYIRAGSEAEALEIARNMKGAALHLPDEIDCGDVPISGLDYGNDELPDLSLSPEMTIHGPDADDFVEEVE